MSRLERLRPREQVTAVCYRTGESGIEFLLIRSRKGRWTFPKGGVEPGLTRAQSAALEAFEEAGVHGRTEKTSFAEYTVRRHDGVGRDEISAYAHLCEVLRLTTPQEPDRNPTWFTPEKAKRCLRAERGPDKGEKLASLVDRALVRINHLLTGSVLQSTP